MANKYAKNMDIQRLKQQASLAVDYNPDTVLIESGQVLYTYADQIKRRDDNFFITNIRTIVAQHGEGKKEKDTIMTLLPVISNDWLNLSQPEKDIIFTTLITMIDSFEQYGHIYNRIYPN